MEDYKNPKEKEEQKKITSTMPRAELRRYLKDKENGKWKDITIPAGPNRAMRRKKKKSI